MRHFSRSIGVSVCSGSLQVDPPPPANWFPQDIVDISETRKLEALERIERVAASYSEDEAE